MILCIFYKVSICPVALNFFSSFYSKNIKVYIIFLFRINIYFFWIYTECCPIVWDLDISITTHLLSSIQRLLPYSTLCFALEKFDTYLLFCFLPALYIFERKGSVDIPPPKKKVYLNCLTRFFVKYIVQNLNFWNFPSFT